jgi:transposase
MFHPMLPVAFWEGRLVDSCTESADGSLLFTLSVDPDHTPRCGRCGGDCALVHERGRRRVRDRDILDRPVWLDVPIQRMDCHHCGGRYAERLSWLETGDRFTRRVRAWVEALVQLLPIQHVAQLTGLNWHTIRNMDHRRLQALHGTFNADGVTRLVMDEFALHKGHQYATVVMDAERLRVLWVGEGRSRAALQPFFDLLGEAGCRRIEAVAMDMNTAFDLEVRARCPQAEVVFDLFHVVARFGREVIDRVRVDQANAVRADRTERRVIKRSRWILLRNPENLSASQSVKLDELLAANAPLATVYLLKTAIKEIWYAPSLQIGARRWKEWYRMARESGIEPVIRFAKRLKPYLRGILASAKYPMHTSVLEGVNNRIKVIKRMAYGYRDTEYFFLKIKHAFPGKAR